MPRDERRTRRYWLREGQHIAETTPAHARPAEGSARATAFHPCSRDHRLPDHRRRGLHTKARGRRDCVGGVSFATRSFVHCAIATARGHGPEYAISALRGG